MNILHIPILRLGLLRERKQKSHLQSAIMYFSLSFTFVKDRIGQFFKMYFVNFFGCVHNMWNFSGQEWNPHHNSDPSHSSYKVGSLTCCATRKLPEQIVFNVTSISLGLSESLSTLALFSSVQDQDFLAFDFFPIEWQVYKFPSREEPEGPLWLISLGT